MSDPARVLRFRSRKAPVESMSPEAAAAAAQAFLAIDPQSRNDHHRREMLSHCDALFAVAKLLREQIDISPGAVAPEAAAIYRWISDPSTKVGLFDEREYLLGETAIVAAMSARLLGKFGEAELWLDRAEGGLRHTINPAGSLATVAFEKLAIRYALGRFDEVLELIPSVQRSFERMGMRTEEAKACFLEAMTRNAVGERQACLEILCRLDRSEVVRSVPALHGQVLVHIGNHYASISQFDNAAQSYEAALPLLMKGRRPIGLAELKWVIGDTYRSQGAPVKALESYQAAKADYLQLGTPGFVAHLNLAIAEILLGIGHPREAEWEILQALPTIEEQKMVPEGFAAVALLRESVKRRKADPNALRELREHLQKQN